MTSATCRLCVAQWRRKKSCTLETCTELFEIANSVYKIFSKKCYHSISWICPIFCRCKLLDHCQNQGYMDMYLQSQNHSNTQNEKHLLLSERHRIYCSRVYPIIICIMSERIHTLSSWHNFTSARSVSKNRLGKKLKKRMRPFASQLSKILWMSRS